MRFSGCFGALAALCLFGGAAVAQTTERVSVSSSEEQGNGGASYYYYPTAPSLSGDGRFVAFESYSTNLVTGDLNGSGDIFVRDRLAGTTERISVSSNEIEGSNSSYRPSISRDGRFVVFESYAWNLVAGDTNNLEDVFIRDRLNGTTERVNLTNAGAQANNGGWNASVSADGRFVAFLSSRLVSGDANGETHVYVRDRTNASTELISLNNSGVRGNRGSDEPSISGNGRFVTFSSTASNFVPDDTNTRADIFVRDRLSRTTERVSVSSTGAQADNHSYYPTISYDGRFVAFGSSASTLVGGDTGGPDSFVRDRALGVTERRSVNTPVTHSGSEYVTAVSDDGRAVAFDSTRTFNTPDANESSDVFVNDRLIGIVDRISVNATATSSGGGGEMPAASADGRFVAFYSYADDLVPGDTNQRMDVFVRDRGSQSVRRRDLLLRGGGLWQWMNGTTWVKVYDVSPAVMAVGNLDGNLSNEAIAGVYGSLIARYNNATWVGQHSIAPISIAVGDLDGNRRDDIISNLGSEGLWVGYSRSNLVKLHPTAPDDIATGDLDGDGKDELIADFGAGGIWVYFNNSAWTRLHTQAPLRMLTGDLDGNHKDELIVDFDAGGLWARKDNGAWTKLHNTTSNGLAIGDLNGNGRGDLLVAFGAGGFWVRYDNGVWEKLHASSPTRMTAADVDGDGKDDVAVDFNAGWIWMRYDTGAWAKIRAGISTGIVAGDFD